MTGTFGGDRPSPEEFRRFRAAYLGRAPLSAEDAARASSKPIGFGPWSKPSRRWFQVLGLLVVFWTAVLIFDVATGQRAGRFVIPIVFLLLTVPNFLLRLRWLRKIERALESTEQGGDQ